MSAPTWPPPNRVVELTWREVLRLRQDGGGAVAVLASHADHCGNPERGQPWGKPERPFVAGCPGGQH